MRPLLDASNRRSGQAFTSNDGGQMVSEPWENQLGSRIVLRLDAPVAGGSPVAYDPKSREFRFAGSDGAAEIALPAPVARPDDLDAAADDIVKRYRARASAQKD